MEAGQRVNAIVGLVHASLPSAGLAQCGANQS